MPARLLVCARDSRGSGPGQYRKGMVAEIKNESDLDYPLWRPAETVAVGDRRYSGAPTKLYEATSGGITGAAPPEGVATVIDGDVTWSYVEHLALDEAPPDFIEMWISDALRADVASWRDEWQQNIDWDIVNSDLSVDGHRLRIWTTNRRASDGLGDFDIDRMSIERRAQILNWLTSWSAVNIQKESRPTGEAGVRLDIGVYGAATSEGFWGRNLAGFSFVELVYVEGSGRHDIRVTYPAGLNHAQVLAEITDRGVPVLTSSEANRTVDYRVTRSAMLDEFKAAMKAAIEDMVMRRQLYFDPLDVDAVVALGGSITRTKAVVEAALRDARND